MPVSTGWNGPDGIAEAVERGLQAGADLLLDESNRKAPVEEGNLIRSGVAKAQGDEAAVGYNTPYAIPQHEELGWRHDEGREAKFLENAQRNHANEIQEAIADEIRRALNN